MAEDSYVLKLFFACCIGVICCIVLICVFLFQDIPNKKRNLDGIKESAARANSGYTQDNVNAAQSMPDETYKNLNNTYIALGVIGGVGLISAVAHYKFDL